MKFKRTMAMVMATAMMLGLAACGGGSSSGGGSSAGGDDEVKIAYIVKAKSDAFWTSMEDGAESFAEEKGIHLEFQAPEKETDVEKQVQMVENAVIKGFDAIVLSAADSNSLAPAIVAASIKVLEMVEAGSELRDRLWANARQFREQMSAAGFTLAGADHAIIPVMLGDAVVAQKFARELQKEGIYVTGFFYPVVPKGQARIRTQMSAAHTPEQITRAVEAFTRIGKQLGVIA